MYSYIYRVGCSVVDYFLRPTAATLLGGCELLGSGPSNGTNVAVGMGGPRRRGVATGSSLKAFAHPTETNEDLLRSSATAKAWFSL
jgi:hypothetical protein